MFVKIVHEEDVSMYQCKIAHVRLMKSKENKALVVIETSITEALDIEVDTTSTGVFIMNDSGKTIDRYIWKN